MAQKLGGISEKAPYEIVVYPKGKTFLETLRKAFSGESSFQIVGQDISQLMTKARLAMSSEVKPVADPVY